MDITEHVKEFRTLQKKQKIRVADFCRERMLDYYEMVEALKKDKFLSELPEEHVVAAELEVTDLPLEHPHHKVKNRRFATKVEQTLSLALVSPSF